MMNNLLRTSTGTYLLYLLDLGFSGEHELYISDIERHTVDIEILSVNTFYQDITYVNISIVHFQHFTNKKIRSRVYTIRIDPSDEIGQTLVNQLKEKKILDKLKVPYAY